MQLAAASVWTLISGGIITITRLAGQAGWLAGLLALPWEHSLYTSLFRDLNYFWKREKIMRMGHFSLPTYSYTRISSIVAIFKTHVFLARSIHCIINIQKSADICYIRSPAPILVLLSLSLLRT